MLTQFDPEQKPHALYYPPAGLERPALINAIDGDLAQISYFVQDSDIDMEGWVPLADLVIVRSQTVALTAIAQVVACEDAEPEEIKAVEYCCDCGLPLHIGRHQIRVGVASYECDMDVEYDDLTARVALAVQAGRKAAR